MPSNFDSWSREELVARLVKLEDLLQSSDGQRLAYPSNAQAKDKKAFSFSAYPLQKIALKFCYSGWAYNGLAYQATPTPLPTVEETLFNALAKCRLIDPDAGFEGCEWERCGRTDRGVSAAGQVVSLMARSSKVKKQEHDRPETPLDGSSAVTKGLDDFSPTPTCTTEAALSKHREHTEMHYISLLNCVLPETIRVYAWAPVVPAFSSRFACQSRHYKYFFASDGLDLSRMREGAARLLGEHDFRNLCKLDPTKQIKTFRRNILRAEISPAETGVAPHAQVYVFDLVGTAFLYHQVRHIMAVLFLVGAGLEEPSVVTALLNADAERPEVGEHSDSPLPIVDRKPEYEMADGLPLMLWDCAYDPADVQWRTDASGPGELDAQTRSGAGRSLSHQMRSIWMGSVIRATLEGHFASAVRAHHAPPVLHLPSPHAGSIPRDGRTLQIPFGGGTFRRTSAYVPLLQRRRQEHVDIRNQNWLTKREARSKGGAAQVDDEAK